MIKKVDVAAAVIRRADGAFLLGQRAPDTFYPGYWEFPGGKVEPGETPYDALVRELSEELAIEVVTAFPWIMREHHYEHAHVRLHFFEVAEWRGSPVDHVHSALSWQFADRLDVSPMLPANGPILKALRLPRVMGITHAYEIGVAAQLERLNRALAKGLKFVQVREPGMGKEALAAFIHEVHSRCASTGALLVVNGAENPLANGIHLPSRQLRQLTRRPEYEWVGASCHTRAELEHAAQLGLDYALLGHVKPSASHPGAPALGWEQFTRLTHALPIPVLAIGGITAADQSDAYERGAHGIAMIRGIWAAS